MLDQINNELSAYSQKWNELLKTISNKEFFQGLKQVAVGWKVADRTEYDKLYSEIHDQCDRIIETWMNGRWVAKMHLKDSSFTGGIEIIKVMERRPGSTDAVGLDHVDFYSKDNNIQQALEAEPDLKWSIENNDVIAGYEWLSVWFNGTEAKIKSDTVLDIIVKELEEINDHIKA
jgi:hypothetical protein